VQRQATQAKIAAVREAHKTAIAIDHPEISDEHSTATDDAPKKEKTTEDKPMEAEPAGEKSKESETGDDNIKDAVTADEKSKESENMYVPDAKATLSDDGVDGYQKTKDEEAEKSTEEPIHVGKDSATADEKSKESKNMDASAAKAALPEDIIDSNQKTTYEEPEKLTEESKPIHIGVLCDGCKVSVLPLPSERLLTHFVF
jgi:hypothetical protein